MDDSIASHSGLRQQDNTGSPARSGTAQSASTNSANSTHDAVTVAQQNTRVSRQHSDFSSTGIGRKLLKQVTDIVTQYCASGNTQDIPFAYDTEPTALDSDDKHNVRWIDEYDREVEVRCVAVNNSRFHFTRWILCAHLKPIPSRNEETTASTPSLEPYVEDEKSGWRIVKDSRSRNRKRYHVAYDCLYNDFQFSPEPVLWRIVEVVKGSERIQPAGHSQSKNPKTGQPMMPINANIPSRLREQLQAWFTKHGSTTLPPCAVLASNKQHFANGFYVDIDGNQVHLRRFRIGNGQEAWVTVAEGGIFVSPAMVFYAHSPKGWVEWLGEYTISDKPIMWRKARKISSVKLQRQPVRSGSDNSVGVSKNGKRRVSILDRAEEASKKLRSKWTNESSGSPSLTEATDKSINDAAESALKPRDPITENQPTKVQDVQVIDMLNDDEHEIDNGGVGPTSDTSREPKSTTDGGKLSKVVILKVNPGRLRSLIQKLQPQSLHESSAAKIEEKAGPDDLNTSDRRLNSQNDVANLESTSKTARTTTAPQSEVLAVVDEALSQARSISTTGNNLIDMHHDNVQAPQAQEVRDDNIMQTSQDGNQRHETAVVSKSAVASETASTAHPVTTTNSILHPVPQRESMSEPPPVATTNPSDEADQDSVAIATREDASRRSSSTAVDMTTRPTSVLEHVSKRVHPPPEIASYVIDEEDDDDYNLTKSSGTLTIFGPGGVARKDDLKDLTTRQDLFSMAQGVLLRVKPELRKKRGLESVGFLLIATRSPIKNETYSIKEQRIGKEPITQVGKRSEKDFRQFVEIVQDFEARLTRDEQLDLEAIMINDDV